MQRYLASLILALSITACGDDPNTPGDDDPGEPFCGDGIKNGTDTCDTSGDTASCDGDCTAVVCGDNRLNEPAGEQCDDGNTTSEDGCSSMCRRELGE